MKNIEFIKLNLRCFYAVSVKLHLRDKRTKRQAVMSVVSLCLSVCLSLRWSSTLNVVSMCVGSGDEPPASFVAESASLRQVSHLHDPARRVLHHQHGHFAQLDV